MIIEDFLLQLCDSVYHAEERAQAEQKRDIFGNQFVPELLVMREDKVRVEIRKENVNHKIPHIHISHTDKIDVTISLIDFSILAGNIDKRRKKYLLDILKPKHKKLIEIWNELNEKENSVGVEKLISNLNL